MLMASVGGSTDTGMHQAKVMMFAFPFLSVQLNRMVCLGCNSLEARVKFTSNFLTSNELTLYSDCFYQPSEIY